MDIDYYDFRDHIDSIEWIYSLPKGLITEKIDTRHNIVQLTKLKDGYQIYVGPKNSENGGDGITITLDKDFRLKHYEIERIEPFPEF